MQSEVASFGEMRRISHFSTLGKNLRRWLAWGRAQESREYVVVVKVNEKAAATGHRSDATKHWKRRIGSDQKGIKQVVVPATGGLPASNDEKE